MLAKHIERDRHTDGMAYTKQKRKALTWGEAVAFGLACAGVIATVAYSCDITEACGAKVEKMKDGRYMVFSVTKGDFSKSRIFITLHAAEAFAYDVNVNVCGNPYVGGGNGH
jgi:hypothetical protein